MNIYNEIPKHRKKKHSSTSNAKEKADHKHEYVECLFIEGSNNYPHKGTYCNICRKIGDMNFFESTHTEDGLLLVLDADETFEKYKNLEQIHIDSIWQKYIPVETK